MTLAVVFDSVGFGEWFVLLAVVLIVVGPRKLPSVARSLGQYYARFRRAADNFKRQLMDMDTEFDRAVAEAAKPVGDAFAVAASEPPPAPSLSDQLAKPPAPTPGGQASTPQAAGGEG